MLSYDIVNGKLVFSELELVTIATTPVVWSVSPTHSAMYASGSASSACQYLSWIVAVAPVPNQRTLTLKTSPAVYVPRLAVLRRLVAIPPVNLEIRAVTVPLVSNRGCA